MSESISLRPIRTSLLRLFSRNGKRDERLNVLSELLQCGSEDQYLELLVGWGVPSADLAGLLNEFRGRRREKRGLLQ